MRWYALAHHLLERVFLQISLKDCYQCQLVCNNWNQVFHTSHSYFWKQLLMRDYNLPLSSTLRLNASSWKDEFNKFKSHTPTFCNDVRYDHTDEVLHCNWSDDGNYITTSSRDRFVLVWNVINNRLKLHTSLPPQRTWTYCQKTAFNKTSNLLLVSGVLNGGVQGEVIIYRIQKQKFVPFIISQNMPHFVFGSWLTSTSYIVGERDVLGLFKLRIVRNLWNVVKVTTTIHTSSCSSDFISLLCVADINIQSQDKLCSKALVFARAAASYFVHQLEVKLISLRYINGSAERDGDSSSSMHSLTVEQNELIRVDHSLNLFAHIIGLEVCRSKVYVNCRKWINPELTNFNVPHELSSEIELRIYNLHTLHHIRTLSTAVANSPSHEPFFIHLNVSPNFIVSGGEGHLVHVFERYYQFPLVQLLQHTGVVNSAIVNPVNKNYMVSGSDDGTVRLWISMSIMKEIRQTSRRIQETSV